MTILEELESRIPPEARARRDTTILAARDKYFGELDELEQGLRKTAAECIDEADKIAA